MYKKTKDQVWDNIVEPLAKAMKTVGINEDSVMGVYSDIMFDKDVSPATRIHSVEIFLKLLGLSAPDKSEVTQKHVIKIKK